MFFYQNNSISANTTTANYDEIGLMNLKEIGSIPMFLIRYKGAGLKRIDLDICGKEFDGDCFKFVEKQFNLFWNQAVGFKNNTWVNTNHPARPCTEEEVT